MVGNKIESREGSRGAGPVVTGFVNEPTFPQAAADKVVRTDQTAPVSAAIPRQGALVRPAVEAQPATFQRVSRRRVRPIIGPHTSSSEREKSGNPADAQVSSASPVIPIKEAKLATLEERLAAAAAAAPAAVFTKDGQVTQNSVDIQAAAAKIVTSYPPNTLFRLTATDSPGEVFVSTPDSYRELIKTAIKITDKVNGWTRTENDNQKLEEYLDAATEHELGHANAALNAATSNPENNVEVSYGVVFHRNGGVTTLNPTTRVRGVVTGENYMRIKGGTHDPSTSDKAGLDHKHPVEDLASSADTPPLIVDLIEELERYFEKNNDNPGSHDTPEGADERHDDSASAGTQAGGSGFRGGGKPPADPGEAGRTGGDPEDDRGKEDPSVAGPPQESTIDYGAFTPPSPLRAEELQPGKILLSDIRIRIASVAQNAAKRVLGPDIEEAIIGKVKAPRPGDTPKEGFDAFHLKYSQTVGSILGAMGWGQVNPETTVFCAAFYLRLAQELHLPPDVVQTGVAKFNAYLDEHPLPSAALEKVELLTRVWDVKTGGPRQTLMAQLRDDNPDTQETAWEKLRKKDSKLPDGVKLAGRTDQDQ